MWSKFSALGVKIVFGMLFITQVYPLIWLVLYSFKTKDEILTGKFLSLPKKFMWSNYSNALEAGHYVRYLMNSLMIALITIVITLILSAMVAYVITRFKWKFSKLVMLVFMIGIMIPMQSTLLPLMIMFKKIHILDTHLSLILPYVAFAIPVAIFILSGFFKTLPRELEESSSIDGASIYLTFFRIILPVIIPPLTTVTILTFIDVWNEYVLASTFISSIDLKTLPFGIYSFFSQHSTNYGIIGAYLILGMLPVMCVYFFLSQKITEGMVAGAIKG
ncbi:carbohydrate ABC transporter permease [Paenibacillus endoradicis]|uniref:carbohydrate ABC transporter permease n=1 Tax=Paenibacillus endoradicis TaxID=2972487 RepID=UPI0021593E29|nr:carbohydrate ABC transporter permease [Paenibacillus endoradicis]MCR8660211.1 carbohydrate ABC transporter permease [Paenibacillus endoradicis]